MIQISNKDRFGKVAVLLGGTSAEREISLRSGEAIVNALRNESVDAYPVDARERVIEQLIEGHYDRVFIALHGKGGEDGAIQGALDVMEIPYTGSNVLGSAIAMDKLRSKQIWSFLGYPVIPAVSIRAENKLTQADATKLFEKLGNPLMVKPAAEGSSIGMTKAETVEQLLEGFTIAAKFGGEVLVETWIHGLEYSVSILMGKALPSIHIKPTREFYDYKAKYTSSGTEYFCPSDLTVQEEEQLASMSLSAFDSLNCSGWGRVDYIKDKQSGKFYLLEANTAPGMTKSSLVPIAAKATGMSFSELVVEILKTSEQYGGEANG